MDPKTAYRLWKTATDPDQRNEAGDALAMWIRAKGFEPDWTPAQRRGFFNWYNHARVAEST